MWFLQTVELPLFVKKTTSSGKVLLVLNQDLCQLCSRAYFVLMLYCHTTNSVNTLQLTDDFGACYIVS